MKKLIICILATLSVNYVDAQLNLNNENTELVIENSTIEKVYLKKGSDKIFLKNDSIIFQRDYYNFNTKETYTFEKQLKNRGFNVPLNQLQDLDNGQQVIDRPPIYIETYFSDETKGKQMIYSNDIIEGLFNNLYNQLNKEIDAYFNQLPSGKYTYSTFINRRVKDNNSDFYKEIENNLIEKGIEDEDIYNQPIIYINKVQSTFDELNKLRKNEIKSYKVIKGEDAIKIYGYSTKNGLVIIETK